MNKYVVHGCRIHHCYKPKAPKNRKKQQRIARECENISLPVRWYVPSET